ncbi:MAG: Crp/Fnr family transcriptional regulator [Sphingomicrobium sp.]
MSTHDPSSLAPLVRKLELWKRLDVGEQEALLALPNQVQMFEAGKFFVSEGEPVNEACLLLSGFAFRQKVTREGRRSISAIHMKGDLVDLQNSLLGYADHSVQALTRGRVALIPRQAIIELAFRMPNVGMAMWYDTLVDASIFREWILNVARRDAPTRIAHLLCEFGLRLEALGLGQRSSYELPMTQDQLADATGLTSVHVNRTLMELEKRGLIVRTVRSVVVSDWPNLKDAGEFDAAYLHMSKATGNVA